MHYHYMEAGTDHGACPYIANIEREAQKNNNFRKAIWTGNNLQMTLMHILPCGEIGVEIHPDTDQFLRIEQGDAAVMIGERQDALDDKRYLKQGDGVFIPAGTWHNVVNTGNIPLKISSIYAPPHHSWGTIQPRKEEEDGEIW